MTKISMKCMINENEELKKRNVELEKKCNSLEVELHEAKEKNDKLLEINNRLAFYDKIEKRESFVQRDEIDPAIEKFIQE